MGSKDFYQWYKDAIQNRAWIKLKYLSMITMGQSPPSEDCNNEGVGYPFLQGTADFGQISPNARVFCENPNKMCLEDSLLLSVRAPVGVQNIADQVYAIGRGLCAIKVGPKLSQKYLWYLVSLSKTELEINSTGTTFEAVSVFDVANMMALVPPLNHQEWITTFLDHKTSQIDKLIAEKEKLLKLLEEKRIALITQAVTKGLNPDVKMKPSGVDWLGDIPEHWEARKLKYGLSGGLKYGANEEAEFDNPSWPRYIRITDFNDEGELYEDTFRSLPEEIASPYLLEDKDILFARSGATVGKSFIYRSKFGRAAYAGYLIRARTNKSLAPEYLYHLLQSQSYWDWIRSSQIQATIQNVSGEKYANFIIPLPPLTEQTEIVKKLTDSTIHIKALVENVQKAIEKLKEYRISVITSAVTGKIDVRNFKPEEEHEEIH